MRTNTHYFKRIMTVLSVFSGTKNWFHEANLFLLANNGKVFSCLIGIKFSGLPACNWLSVFCTYHFMVNYGI